MKKRRRERDRPKAGPEAVYNPNKRVLLSYASDEEEEGAVDEHAPDTGHYGAVETVSDHHKTSEDTTKEQSMPEAWSKDSDALHHAQDGLELDLEYVSDDDDGDGPSVPSRSVKKSMSTNQTPALGSLSYQWDEENDGEEAYDSTEEEAMAYLKAVRSERQGLPSIFTATHANEDDALYDGGVGDSKGYVSDGAYIARPVVGPTAADRIETLIDPQDAYTTALKDRFVQDRDLMCASPAADRIAALGDKHPISLPAGSNKAFAEWSRIVTITPPVPTQLQSMDRDTVHRLLELIQRIHLLRGRQINTTTSTWIWSLLARLDDVGAMDNDEVYAIRELGKQAILVQLSFHDPNAAQRLECMSAAEQSGHDAVLGPDAIDSITKSFENSESAVTTSQDDGQYSPARQNTLATLDMIVAIVGEVFGQKDLLEFRKQWNEASPPP